MKRKLVFLGLILALVALPITACAQEAPAPAPAPKPEPIVLTAVQSGPLGGPEFVAWEWYVKEVNQRSGGELKIDVIGGPDVIAVPDQANAVKDGHFPTVGDSPHYAVSMGAELVYQARTVLLLANGERKVESVARSLQGDVTPEIPISYGRKYAERGGNLIYVIDIIAGKELLARKSDLAKKGVKIKDMTKYGIGE